MLPFLSKLLIPFWGPFRLLDSYLVLLGIGSVLAMLLTHRLLPGFWGKLPQDHGKALVKGGELAKGKPTGAGFILVNVFCVVALLVMPFSWRMVGILFCLYACMLTGFMDDRSEKPWGQLKKGLLDAAISLGGAFVLCEGRPMQVWLPLIKGAGEGGSFTLPALVYIPIAGFILWICINAVNCSDGVDGLAGSLSLLTLFCLGGFLYGITGHVRMAKYLLLPHYVDGARWAVLLYTACGMLAGYLWYNAKPSMVMMGDAGSRFLGLLIGMAGLASGNPFMILVVCPILLADGGAGLAKLVLLRFLKKCGYDVRMPLRKVVNPIHPENFATDEEASRQMWLVRFIHRFRFPIHDQCRKELQWSDTQVLVRFMLLQAAITPICILLFIKLR